MQLRGISKESGKFDPTFDRGQDYTLRPSVIFSLCQQLDAFNVDASSAHTCVAQTKESRPAQCLRVGVQTFRDTGDFGDIGDFCLRQVSLSAEIAEKVQAGLESLQSPNAEIISNEVPIICLPLFTHPFSGDFGAYSN